MALTAAQRAKKYRDKLKENPEKYAEQMKKKAEYMKKSRKRIAELTDEEKEKKRKIWREEKKQQKMKRKHKECYTETTSTPKHQNNEVSAFRYRYKKLQRLYQNALNSINLWKTKHATLRKKLYREKLEYTKQVHSLQTEIDKLMARQEILEISLRNTYGTTKTTQEKKVLKSIAVNEVVKTNKSVKAVASCLGLRGRIRFSKKKTQKNKSIREIIEAFYLRDDISRITAGRKETRTRGKKKMQIRYLTDTLQNLYDIYKKEGGVDSFTTFFRYKPFYVLSPTAKNRDTCMCIKHSNMEYIFAALKNKKVIDYKNLEDAIVRAVCDKKSYACMYNKCQKCINLNLQFNEQRFEDEITWFKWERVTHTYQKNDKNFTTKKTAKQLKKDIVKNLVSEFKTEFTKFKVHYYNWKEQQRQYRLCTNNLGDKEIAILVDFSENYDCKLGSEIQSMHFGASKNNITLHCGMIYWKEKAQSFVTISDNGCHEPNAIWAHLLPILKFIKESEPSVEIIHFFSDGPTSQYRQKKNFYLINLFTAKLKLKYMTWSFSESGHGKGVADGIGGTVKRQLDRHVSYGHDVVDAKEAYEHLSKSLKNIKCFIISDNDIENMNTIIPSDLQAVPETMKLHQIISMTEKQILYRQLSCFCGNERGLCFCLDPKTHYFKNNERNRNANPTASDNDVKGELTEKVRDDELTKKVRDDQFISSLDKKAFCEASDHTGVQIVDASGTDFCDKFNQRDTITANTNDIENYKRKNTQCVPSLDSPKKKIKVLKTIKNETYQTKSLKTIINRQFICHVCKLRRLFVISDMTKCIACKNWVCRNCCDQPVCDYICDRCFDE